MNKIDPNFTDFDIIGDIHGHSNDLKLLLNKLDYKKKDGYYQHPTRKALFLGDYIDRGINVVEVLEIVKAMVDNNQAIALMGNHEYNAICYNTKDSQGNYLREHSKKNFNQHAVTMAAFMQDPDSYKMYIQWFTSLPLFYETPKFRAVHACWDQKSIDYLKTLTNQGVLPLDLFPSAHHNHTVLFKSIEVVLKGLEVALPQGELFYDKDRVLRKNFRVNWWSQPNELTYQGINAMQHYELSNNPVDIKKINFYPTNQKPVFFGHYWMRPAKGESPKVLQHNAACLDFSVASEGALVAYRYQGEQNLDSNHIYYIA
ncbi:metallophosphoesterase [Myroides sp. LJL119]